MIDGRSATAPGWGVVRHAGSRLLADYRQRHLQDRVLGDADSNVASGTAPEPDSGGASPVPIVRGQPADGEMGEDLGDLLDRQRAPGEQLVEGLEAAEHPRDVERPRWRDVG